MPAPLLFILGILKDMGLMIVKAMISEKVKKQITIIVLRELAELTESKVDDQMVAPIIEELEKN